MSSSARRGEAPHFRVWQKPVELRSTGQMRTSVPRWFVVTHALPRIVHGVGHDLFAVRSDGDRKFDGLCVHFVGIV